MVDGVQVERGTQGTESRWRGRASAAASDADAVLDQQRIATCDADARFVKVAEAARDADADSRSRLDQVRQQIVLGVAALRPSLDTPAGQSQMSEFLAAKAAEVQQINEDSRNDAHRFAAVLHALGDDYELLAERQVAKQASLQQGEANQNRPTNPAAKDAGSGFFMAGWGPAPLSPAETPPEIPTPPSPTPRPALPAPLQDFTDYQLQGQQTPPWAPPAPPHTGEPINLGPSGPRPPMVITLGPSDGGPVDLFPDCDTRQVLKATGQLAAGGIGAAVAVSSGPFTGGLTWAGLGVAAITLTDAIDALAVCKGIS